MPIPLFAIGVVLIAALLTGWVFIVFDYFSLRARLHNTARIQEQYDQQDQRIEEFSQRNKLLQFHFENLETLNQKLRQMTSMRADTNLKTIRENKSKAENETALASKEGILRVIASDLTEIDSDHINRLKTNFQNLNGFFHEKQSPLSSVPRGWPVNGFLMEKFGPSIDPYTRQVKPQYGIDIATRSLHPFIKATAGGIVIYAKPEAYYGNLLVIDHGSGFVTRYGHIERFEVEEGDVVREGTIIAIAGNTGRTTGTRLHYEVILNHIPQNPLKFIYN